MTYKLPEYKIGDRVYHNLVLAEVVGLAGRTYFKNTPKYLIEPYADQLPRMIVKETKLIRAHV